MTARGVALVLGGAVLVVVGWLLAWPELTVLGAVAVALVLLSACTALGGARMLVRADAADLSVARGDDAVMRVEVTSSGRRSRLVRLVQGRAAAPEQSFPLPRMRRGEAVTVTVPLDTRRRGLHCVGPFQVVRGDAWSIVRRVLGTSNPATMLVRPRAHPVRAGFASLNRQGDTEAMTRRSGDDHFFALRDYVLGDEPRNVHWRSSARSGRLVVKQKVAAAVDGTLVVLDVDSSSFPSIESFGAGFDADRFEEAVEVAASLVRARLADGHRVRLGTTARQQSSILLDASLSAMLDTLAVVDPLQPMECDPVGLMVSARRSHCSHLILVSGAPGPELLSAARRCGSLSPVVVRVGGVPTGHLPGLSIVDVPSARALA